MALEGRHAAPDKEASPSRKKPTAGHRGEGGRESAKFCTRPVTNEIESAGEK